MRSAYQQSESHSAYCNDSGAEANKCGEVPTVSVTLPPAGRKPPPHESSCDEGNYEQDGHAVNPQ